MGMYTEIYLSVSLKEDTPSNIIDVLKYMFSDKCDNQPKDLPKHEFFILPRWEMIGRGSSCYFVPRPTSAMWEEYYSDGWYITSRSDLKNYSGEVEAFFDFLMPYVDAHEGEFIGYSRYEEDDTPAIILKRGE